MANHQPSGTFGFTNRGAGAVVPTPMSATFGFRDMSLHSPSAISPHTRLANHHGLGVSSPNDASAALDSSNGRGLSRVAMRRRIAPPRVLSRSIAPPTPSTPNTWSSPHSSSSSSSSPSAVSCSISPGQGNSSSILSRSKQIFSRVRRSNHYHHQFLAKVQSPMSDDANSMAFHHPHSPLSSSSSSSSGALPAASIFSPTVTAAYSTTSSSIAGPMFSPNGVAKHLSSSTATTVGSSSLNRHDSLTSRFSSTSTAITVDSGSAAGSTNHHHHLHNNNSHQFSPESSTTLCNSEFVLPPMPMFSRSQPANTLWLPSATSGHASRGLRAARVVRHGKQPADSLSVGTSFPPSPSSMASPHNSSSPVLASPVSSPAVDRASSPPPPPPSCRLSSSTIPSGDAISHNPPNSVLFSPLPELDEETEADAAMEVDRRSDCSYSIISHRQLNGGDGDDGGGGQNHHHQQQQTASNKTSVASEKPSVTINEDWVEEWVDVETEVAIADARVSSEIVALNRRSSSSTVSSTPGGPILDAFSGLGIGNLRSARFGRRRRSSSEDEESAAKRCQTAADDGERPAKSLRKANTVYRRLCQSIGVVSTRHSHELPRRRLPHPKPQNLNLAGMGVSFSTPCPVTSPANPPKSASAVLEAHQSTRRLPITSPFRFTFSPTQLFFPHRNGISSPPAVETKPRLSVEQLHEHYQLAETYLFGRNGQAADGRVAVSHMTAMVTGPINHDIQYQALAVLGFCFEFGLGIKPDSVAAERFYLQAAEESGNSLAMVRLVFLYKYGRTGVSIDHRKAGFWHKKLHELASNNAVAWLAMASLEEMHPAAQYALGLCYHNGVGVAPDAQKAFELYWLSANGNHPRGQGILGYCYSEGYGVEPDKEEAFRWYQRAAAQGEPVAMYNLGYCYEDGVGIERNLELAVLWYRRSAELGNALAQNSLGYCYEDGLGVPKNECEAIKWYTLSAQQGYAWAQCNLGYCYQYGIGTDTDATEAVVWYRQAALQGHARAQHNLGFCYQYGIGIEKNDHTAFEWYERAAVQGNTFAFHSLGYCYQNGVGVDKDPRLAVYWYRRAADDRHAPAILSLGYCYRNAVGVEKDDNEAFRWFREAALLGNALAQNALGYCYEEGIGTERDPRLAFQCYSEAAQQQNPWAMCNVGACYAQGIGVSVDLNEAFRWYKLSAQEGHARAMEKLALLLLDHASSTPNVAQLEQEAVKWLCLAAQDYQHPPAMYWLGHCFEEGRGVMRDTEQAIGWYRRAADAGESSAFERIRSLMIREWGLFVTPDGTVMSDLCHGSVPPVA